MKKVYECDDAMLAGHLVSLLEGNAIACHLRNLSLTGGIGELPINECWPEVWVNNACDEDEARQLISAALAEAKTADDWYCTCGAQVPGQFGTCWSCGMDKQE